MGDVTEGECTVFDGVSEEHLCETLPCIFRQGSQREQRPHSGIFHACIPDMCRAVKNNRTRSTTNISLVIECRTHHKMFKIADHGSP